ncbi:hypothetical protein CYMTET_51258 [Cymbomonas tetramitiformis]|uniref:Uncharacterized protein n=1 Tax=Cymbomonas tetramitiformis TaxID=36881 RepID=A0AAE0BMN2_9CHLO|nr:hypothetical protein CYMTET_51258 [Cymbomonas tetramitiformis]
MLGRNGPKPMGGLPQPIAGCGGGKASPPSSDSSSEPASTDTAEPMWYNEGKRRVRVRGGESEPAPRGHRVSMKDVSGS